MTNIKWHRSNDGYVDSHCGRFDIRPLYWGSPNPQSYALHYGEEGSIKGKLVECDTQEECKRQANTVDF